MRQLQFSVKIGMKQGLRVLNLVAIGGLKLTVPSDPPTGKMDAGSVQMTTPSR
jgi:hypothetical protein